MKPVLLVVIILMLVIMFRFHFGCLLCCINMALPLASVQVKSLFLVEYIVCSQYPRPFLPYTPLPSACINPRIRFNFVGLLPVGLPPSTVYPPTILLFSTILVLSNTIVEQIFSNQEKLQERVCTIIHVNIKLFTYTLNIFRFMCIFL